jgi:hypothetical protein
MREIIETEARWILSKMVEIGPGAHDYNYYQGRIDQLSWILKQLEPAA